MVEIPEIIKLCLDAYMVEVDRQLPDKMTAFYLHGSIALGAYQHGLSDIDFITVLSHPASQSDISCLIDIHHQLKQAFPDANFSGSYLQMHDLGRLADTIAAHPCYHDGVLNPHGHHDINVVTWWILKHHGISMRGSAAQDLPFTVEWERIVLYMQENINSYWRQFTVRPMRMIWMLTDEGIQWAVLGVLRQFYSFREGDIVSKIGAGEYALKQLPTRWHGIIQEALNIRKQNGISLFHVPILRAIEARQFVSYIIDLCHAEYAANMPKQKS